MSVQDKNRLVWLDWMKVIAIFSIIWGHFFSAGHVYLYVFSVQVFCVISGFLYKKAPDWKTCIINCFWQLFVPTVIMSVIMQLEMFCRFTVLGKPYELPLLWYFKWLLLGQLWCMGTCWYFYTLIVMRIIMQVLPQRKWMYAVLFVLLSAGAIALNNKGIEISNANTNVLVCMPMFLMGVFLKPLKTSLTNLHHYALEGALLVVAVTLVWFCGQYNGYVWMYLCGYGNYYILYIIGGMVGTLLLYILSLWLSRLPYRSMVTTLSQGSILIIGLHIVIVRRLTELPNRLLCEDLLMALFILIGFIPLISLADCFFPLLLGHHKRK